MSRDDAKAEIIDLVRNESLVKGKQNKGSFHDESSCNLLKLMLDTYKDKIATKLEKSIRAEYDERIKVEKVNSTYQLLLGERESLRLAELKRKFQDLENFSNSEALNDPPNNQAKIPSEGYMSTKDNDQLLAFSKKTEQSLSELERRSSSVESKLNAFLTEQSSYIKELLAIKSDVELLKSHKVRANHFDSGDTTAVPKSKYDSGLFELSKEMKLIRDSLSVSKTDNMESFLFSFLNRMFDSLNELILRQNDIFKEINNTNATTLSNLITSKNQYQNLNVKDDSSLLILEKEKSALEYSLNESDSLLKDLKNKYFQLQQKYNQLQQLSSQKNDFEAELKNQLSIKEEQIRKNEKDCQQLYYSVESLIEEKNKLSAEYEKAINVLEEKNSLLKNEYEQSDCLIKELKDKLKSQDAVHVELTKTLQRLEHETFLRIKMEKENSVLTEKVAAFESGALHGKASSLSHNNASSMEKDKVILEQKKNIKYLRNELERKSMELQESDLRRRNLESDLFRIKNSCGSLSRQKQESSNIGAADTTEENDKQKLLDILSQKNACIEELKTLSSNIKRKNVRLEQERDHLKKCFELSKKVVSMNEKLDDYKKD